MIEIKNRTTFTFARTVFGDKGSGSVSIALASRGRDGDSDEFPNWVGDDPGIRNCVKDGRLKISDVKSTGKSSKKSKSDSDSGGD